MKIGATVLVLNEKEEILLTQRHDLKIWVFPGGGAGKYETPEQAARREVEEETGFRIKITRLVAVYIKDHWLFRGINFFFLAKKIGGSERRQGGEVLETRWVKKSEAKKYLELSHLQRLKDAFTKNGEIKVRIDNSPPILRSQIPSFIWRRRLGKWLRLVKL